MSDFILCSSRFGFLRALAVNTHPILYFTVYVKLYIFGSKENRSLVETCRPMFRYVKSEKT